jgi:hypothetical protein
VYRRSRGQDCLALLLRQCLGNRLAGLFPAGYEAVLPYCYDLPVDQFVLDFANRDMVDVAALKSLPIDKEVAVGVIDVRPSLLETPGQVTERIRKVLEVVPPERVYLTTDGGMKPLARTGGPDEAASAGPGSATGPRGAGEQEKE